MLRLVTDHLTNDLVCVMVEKQSNITMKFKIFYTESDLDEDGKIFEFNCEADSFLHAVDKIPADLPGIVDWEYIEDT